MQSKWTEASQSAISILFEIDKKLPTWKNEKLGSLRRPKRSLNDGDRCALRST